jgi:ABC-2 type transport system permease protein
MAAVLIAAKDLRGRVRDRTVLITALVVPFVLATILGLTIPNITLKSGAKYTFGVANEDTGPAGLFFVKEVLGPLQHQAAFRLLHTSSKAQARALVGDNRATAAFVLPPGFTTAAQGEAPTHIEIVGTGEVLKQAGTYVARAIALNFTDRLDSVRLAIASTRKSHSNPAEVINLGEHASEVPRQLQLHEATVRSKELDTKSHEVAGFTVLFLFITVGFGFPSIIEERDHGTLTRLLAASVPRRSIIFGKLLTSIVLGLLSTTVLIATTTLLLGAHWGGVPGVALLVGACLLAATAMTACITTFAPNAEQAGQWQQIAAVLLGALGGAMFPIAQAGGTLESLSLLTPPAQFLRGLGLLANGAGPGAVLPMVGAILLFAALLGGIALLRMRRLTEL